MYRWLFLLAVLNLPAQDFVQTLRLGGSGFDTVRQLHVDAAGNRYLLGSTNSPDFPVVNAFRPRILNSAIVRSDDGGRSWIPTALPDGEPPDWFRPSGTYAFLQSSQGLWRSSAKGDVNSWTLVAPRERFADLAIDPGDPLHLFAVRGSDVIESRDGGVSWQTTSEGMEAVPRNGSIEHWITNLYLFESSPHWLIALGWNGLYVRPVEGGSWQTISPQGNYGAVTALGNTIYFVKERKLWRWDGTATEARTNHWCDLLLADSYANRIYCRAGIAYQSEDRGDSWVPYVGAKLVYNWASTPAGLLLAEISKLYSVPQAAAFDGPVNGLWYTSGSIYVRSNQTHNYDVFLTKLDPNNRILFSTLIGGVGLDLPDSLAVDKEGNIYVSGYSNSPDLEGAYGRSTAPGTLFGFVAKFSSGGAWIGGYSFDARYWGQRDGLKIIIGKDNTIWVVNRADAIFRFDTNLTRLIGRYFLPSNSTASSPPILAMGPDGVFIYRSGSQGGWMIMRLDGEFLWIGAYFGEPSHGLVDLAVDPQGRMITVESIPQLVSPHDFPKARFTRWGHWNEPTAFIEEPNLFGSNFSPGIAYEKLVLGEKGSFVILVSGGGVLFRSFETAYSQLSQVKLPGASNSAAWAPNGFIFASSDRWSETGYLYETRDRDIVLLEPRVNSGKAP